MLFLSFGLASIVLLCLVWRIACTKYNIPWPYWLAWWLENPYMVVFCPPKRIVRLAGVDRGKSVLELGCGAGRITFPMARKSQTSPVVGLDFQLGMLRLFQKRQKKEKLQNISCIQANIFKDPLPEGVFDIVCIVTVLGEIPDYGQVFHKLKGVLADDGIISITEVLPDPCYIPSWRLRKEMEDAGFQHLKTFRNLVSYTMNFQRPDC